MPISKIFFNVPKSRKVHINGKFQRPDLACNAISNIPVRRQKLPIYGLSTTAEWRLLCDLFCVGASDTACVTGLALVSALCASLWCRVQCQKRTGACN